MKQLSCLIGLCGLFAPMTGLSQAGTLDPRVVLATIADNMTSGIYERLLNFGYIASPAKATRRQQLLAHNEFTLLFFRFYGFSPTADQRARIGKVFVSERYLELDYNKKYKSRADYETDKDGTFMACKLYFDERSLEYRLNIYPDHLLNICRYDRRPYKGMHFNDTLCTTTAQHWESLKYVLSISDKHYDDFSQEDNPDSIRTFLKGGLPTLNIARHYLDETTRKEDDDSVAYKPTGKTRNLLREINLRKKLKIVRVGYIEDSLTTIGKTLTLKFTKYALSEDLGEGTEYTYTFLHRDSLRADRLAERSTDGEFVSRNPLYRSLLVSPEPDDMFVPGLTLNPDRPLSYLGDNTYPKNTRTSAAGQLKREDVKFSQKQNQIYGLDKIPVSSSPASGSERLFVTAPTTRTTYWVYGGAAVAGQKKIKSGDRLALPGSVYLRDTIPMVDNKLWLKGHITFWGGTCCIAPADRAWRVNADTILTSGTNRTYHWLNVSHLTLTPKTAQK